MMRRTLLLTGTMLVGAGALHPCGGPDRAWIDTPLVPIQQLAGDLLYPFDGFEASADDRLRFLHALALADSARVGASAALASARLSSYADTSAADNEPVSAAAFDAAVLRNDRTTATREARALVTALLALPAPVASNGTRILRRAVEYLDLLPLLEAAPTAPIAAILASSGGTVRRLAPAEFAAWAAAHPTHPRAASVQLRVLQQRVATRVPNGWLDEIRAAMPAAAWDSLHAEHRQWLREHPTHPLARLVEANRVRLWYLAGDSDAAWRALLTLYETVPDRAAHEMRFLLVAGMHPPAELLSDTRVPIELRTALVGSMSPSRSAWSALWALSEGAAAAPLRENLQERLLAAVAYDSLGASGVLPERFPAYQHDASDLWRQLWAIAQLRARNPREALRLEARPVRDSADVSADVLARAHLQLREYSAAILVPSLRPDARRFLLHVIAADSVLDLVRAAPDSAARHEAIDAAVSRLVLGGGWREAAAQLRPVDRARSVRLERAAVLASDTSLAGLLAFARWLTAQQHTLLRVADDPLVWYRTLSWRHWRPERGDSGARTPDETADLPWTLADEQPWIDRHFRGTFEDWHALRCYRRYFERTAGTKHPARAAAVREANAAYRRLVDYGRLDDMYWQDVLPQSPEAVAIRRAGRGN